MNSILHGLGVNSEEEKWVPNCSLKCDVCILGRVLLCLYFAKSTLTSKYVSDSLELTRNCKTKEALANVVSHKIFFFLKKS